MSLSKLQGEEKGRKKIRNNEAQQAFGRRMSGLFNDRKSLLTVDFEIQGVKRLKRECEMKTRVTSSHQLSHSFSLSLALLKAIRCLIGPPTDIHSS